MISLILDLSSLGRAADLPFTAPFDSLKVKEQTLFEAFVDWRIPDLHPDGLADIASMPVDGGPRRLRIRYQRAARECVTAKNDAPVGPALSQHI